MTLLMVVNHTDTQRLTYAQRECKHVKHVLHTIINLDCLSISHYLSERYTNTHTHTQNTISSQTLILRQAASSYT